MCLARTGEPSEDLLAPTEDIDRLQSSTTSIGVQRRSVTSSEQRGVASEGGNYKGDEGDQSERATLLASERTPEAGNQRCPPPGFRNTPQFQRSPLETSPGFERPYEGCLRPPQEKTMPPEERVAEWICSETTDEVPDLEEAEKEKRGMYVFRVDDTSEEVDTGFGKSNTSREASTVSSQHSGSYHSFGAAQVHTHKSLTSLKFFKSKTSSFKTRMIRSSWSVILSQMQTVRGLCDVSFTAHFVSRWESSASLICLFWFPT